MSWPAWTVHYSSGRGITQTIFCRALRSVSLRPKSAPPCRYRLHSADQGLITHCHWFTTFGERQWERAWDACCGFSPGPTLKSNLVHRPRKRQSKEQEKRVHLETIPERIWETAEYRGYLLKKDIKTSQLEKRERLFCVVYDLRPIKCEFISNVEKSLEGRKKCHVSYGSNSGR